MGNLLGMMTPTVRELSSDLFLIEGLLSPNLCRQVIEVAELAGFQPSNVALQDYQPRVRSSDHLRLEGSSLLASSNQLLLKAIGWIQNWLQGHYGMEFPVAETCSVLRYGPGQAYRRHVDNLLLGSRLEEARQQVPTRDVSLVGYLNEDFEGGETAFDRQDLWVKPQQGAVLVFPSFFTYPHQALAVTSGRKYVFTSWLYH